MKNLAPAMEFFRRCLGEDWESAPMARITSSQVAELLWPLGEVFRPRLAEIRALKYDPKFAAAADSALDDWATNLDITVLAQAPLGVLRVLYERHTQMLLVAMQNEKAGNMALTVLPHGLSADQQPIALALAMLRGMKLPYPPSDPTRPG